MPSKSSDRLTRTVSLDTGYANQLKVLAATLTEKRGEPVTIRDLVSQAVEQLLMSHGMKPTPSPKNAKRATKKKD